jgi:hypothetical protein
VKVVQEANESDRGRVRERNCGRKKGKQIVENKLNKLIGNRFDCGDVFVSQVTHANTTE